MSLQHTPMKLRNRNGNVLNNQAKNSINKGNMLTSQINKTFSVNQSVKKTAMKNSSLSQPLKSSNEMIIIDDENATAVLVHENELKDLSLDQTFELILERTTVIMNAYNGLHETIVKYQKTISDLVSSNENLAEENVCMKKRLDNLEAFIKNEKEIAQNETRDLTNKCNSLQQEIKNDECEFWGIDETKEEDLIPLIMNIAKEFDVNIQKEDIIYAARKKKFHSNTRNFVPRPIRVKFYNRIQRNALIKAGKFIRIRKHVDVDQRNGANFIYINEALTRHNEFIYGKARELMKKKKIEKTWCRLGKIYVKGVNCTPKLIDNFSDLNEFE